MTCDNNRPCGRCVRRNISHLCHDEPRKFDEATDQALILDEEVGSEFNSINEFLNLMESNELFAFGDFKDPLSGMAPPVTSTEMSATEKFMLTAADPSNNSPEDRIRQVIDAKVSAGLLRPFNYVAGYDRLREYMDMYMADQPKQRVLASLAKIRPSFRMVAKSLSDLDLIMVEENFERMLLDYDRIFSSVAIPACLWRRTGDIFRGNKEFAELIQCSVEDLRNGKLAIYQVMSEDSTVNYWEKYGSLAFNSTQKAVISSCTLRTLQGRKRHQCCFSFTIIRDKYNIPSLIIGNFIPII